MDSIVIEMRKIKSTKRFDVFESVVTNANITSLYINKAANCPEEIKVTVADGSK